MRWLVRASGSSGADFQPPRPANSLLGCAALDCAVAELQYTPEGCRFDVGCGKLASEVVDLVLGGEELIRHESRCFGKIVVRETQLEQ